MDPFDRAEAQAVLGVGPKASPADIQAAFRRRARELHPDGSGDGDHDGGPDLHRLMIARDLLLGGDVPPDVSEPASAPDPAVRPPAAGTAGPPRHVPAPEWSSARGCLVLLLGFGALVIVVTLLISIAAIIVGESSENPVDEGETCIVIQTDGVREVDCTEPRALRVVAEFTGARTCPEGSDALVSGDQTWCLEPAEAP